MKKTLTFNVAIAAPRPAVWKTMLGIESYTQWTSPFCEGSYYEGSWKEGSRILFLAPNGEGMVAEIAENRPHECVSIRHLGEFKGGVEDTTSEAVRAWAPAYEKYIFTETKDGTEVTVEVETLPDYEQYMLETYPKALNILRELCEAK
jgi:hypothetical protein